jgi:hypothetical protein
MRAFAAVRPRIPRMPAIHYQNCAVWTSETFLSKPILYLSEDEKSHQWGAARASWKETSTMTHIAKKPVPKLRRAPQPPLSHAGAIPDSYRAKRPPLSEPSATGLELTPGDRVEGLGNFGMPTGELGTVQQTNEDDALVKWDDDGRTRLQQLRLKKTSK